MPNFVKKFLRKRKLIWESHRNGVSGLGLATMMTLNELVYNSTAWLQ